MKASYEDLLRQLEAKDHEIEALKEQIVAMVIANGTVEVDGKDVPLWPYSKLIKIECECGATTGMDAGDEAPDGWAYLPRIPGWICPPCHVKPPEDLNPEDIPFP